MKREIWKDQKEIEKKRKINEERERYKKRKG